MMKQFKFWNTISGWMVFAVAAVTYFLTMEPTASFWDCGEFISSAAKLDVGHPPGAPFFMLMGHFFSLFASSPEQVAACVNALSVLASAFTILFLFWTITLLARKLVEPDTLWRQIGILVAGAVGALAYTFSDTFWFSAVEGEVYASSSLFTAVVFWLILKWDEHADEEGSDRWLIAIAYLMGLSIGVHLLNLLTIPAIGLVYYFRRYQFKWWSFIVAFFASCAVLMVILYGIIPGFPTVAGWFELLFVNDFHCPFNTGLAVYLVLMIGSLVWAIVETYLDKNKIRIAISFTLAFALSGAAFLFENWIAGLIISTLLLAVLIGTRNLISTQVLNTVSVMLAVIMAGYLSYTAIVIRSNAKTPMDQNSPSNVFALKYYLNREQYGDRPLFYGQTFDAPMKRGKEGAPQYAPAIHVDGQPDRYDVVDHKSSPDYQKDFCMIFPRMYSSDPNHIKAYKSWTGIPDGDSKEARQIIKEHTKKVDRKGGYIGGYEYKNGVPVGYKSTAFCPTFGENLRFFFDYQVHFMYWRYFMWNFVGRQNDLQSYGDITKGQWISGIPFIDNARLGDQSKLPKELLENKGRNTYYFLPLILGLLGIFWQISRRGKEHKFEGVRNFTLVQLLFFLTGLAIVIYLNQTPYQPRERDYAYAGSFYAFCIWIGFGALALIDWIIRGVHFMMKLNLQYQKKPIEKEVIVTSDNAYRRFLVKIQNVINNQEVIMPKSASTSIAALMGLACLAVPIQMATQNWDDHDRSKRYVCRDFGANYIKSCEPGGILFSNGDNDTFPLWYNQEVEGVGDSLRVCNLSYLQTDWYIDQMKRPYYHSEGLPISWSEKDYRAKATETARVDFDHHALIDISTLEKEQKDSLHQKVNNINAYCDNLLRYAKTAEEQMEIEQNRMEELESVLIQKGIYNELSVKEAFDYMLKSGKHIIPATHLYVLAPDSSKVDIKGVATKSYLTRSEMMILEMLSTNEWKRPMYFCTTVGESYQLGLEPYMELTGMAYQITPHRSPTGEPRVNTEKMYENMMHKFRYGNVKAPGIYLDENTMRMCITHRSMFGTLAEALINEAFETDTFNVLMEKELERNYLQYKYDYDYLYYQKQWYKGDFSTAFVRYELRGNYKLNKAMYKYINSDDKEIIDKFIDKEKIRKAEEVLAKCEEELPGYNVPYSDYSAVILMKSYYELAMYYEFVGELDKANNARMHAETIIKTIGQNFTEYMNFIHSLSLNRLSGLEKGSIARQASILNYVCGIAEEAGDDSWEQTYKFDINDFESFNSNPQAWYKNNHPELVEEPKAFKKRRSY